MLDGQRQRNTPKAFRNGGQGQRNGAQTLRKASGKASGDVEETAKGVGKVAEQQRMLAKSSVNLAGGSGDSS